MPSRRPGAPRSVPTAKRETSAPPKTAGPSVGTAARASDADAGARRRRADRTPSRPARRRLSVAVRRRAPAPRHDAGPRAALGPAEPAALGGLRAGAQELLGAVGP